MESFFQFVSSFVLTTLVFVVVVEVELLELLDSLPLECPLDFVSVVVSICLTKLHSTVTYRLCDGGMFTS